MRFVVIFAFFVTVSESTPLSRLHIVIVAWVAFFGRFAFVNLGIFYVITNFDALHAGVFRSTHIFVAVVGYVTHSSLPARVALVTLRLTWKAVAIDTNALNRDDIVIVMHRQRRHFIDLLECFKRCHHLASLFISCLAPVRVVLELFELFFEAFGVIFTHVL